jgi:TonB family protein
MSLPAAIRASLPRSELETPFRGGRTLAIAVLAAAAIHLLAFMAAGQLGWDYQSLALDIELPTERFLELTLEVNEPAAEPPPETAETAAAAPPESSAPPPEASPLPSDAALLEGGDAEAIAASSEDRTVNLEESAPLLKSYNSMVRTAVARHWILPPAARSNFQPGRFVAVMTLNRQGQVLVIMVEESSGIPSLDFAAMEALRGAAPYPPFPEELSNHESLNFRLHFDYRTVQRRPGTGSSYDLSPQ